MKQIYTDLQSHAEQIKGLHLRDLFEQDPERFNRFHIEWRDFLFDYSKNRITSETMDLLIRLAEESGLRQAIEDMFTGKRINTTENRPVLHTALRNRDNHPIFVDDKDVMPEINAVLDQMHVFTDKVRSGQWLGATGQRITDIVNIGIGGSDLGPAMVVEALAHYKTPELKFHFVSNIDGTDMVENLQGQSLTHVISHMVMQNEGEEKPAAGSPSLTSALFGNNQSWDEGTLVYRFQHLMQDELLFLRQGLTLQDVAERLDSNKTYISKMVNQTYGIGFPEVLNIMRVDYAQQYMNTHAEAAQEDIAKASGFQSASSFNSTFKRITGYTPKVWASRK